MNLLFAINGGYIPTFLNCMRSVLLHGGASHYEVFLLHSDLTDGDEADIRAALPDVGLHFVFVDPAMFDGFPESKRYPRQIYYRIAAPLLLPDTLERILYLDADTIIINPLTTLYTTPFGDAYFMACTHTRKLLEKLNAARLGMDEAAPYINTGVLLYNLPALRADLDMERVRAFADEKQDVFLLPDQDILTALYGDRVHLLDSMVYNLSDRILAPNEPRLFSSIVFPPISNCFSPELPHQIVPDDNRFVRASITASGKFSMNLLLIYTKNTKSATVFRQFCS